MRKLISLLIVLYCSLMTMRAQTSLGTEIWVQPGQTEEQIDGWCKMAADCGLRDIRIFIMWTHVEPQKDTWDWECYDYLYKACEKYGLKVQATLNPNQPAWHYGREFWGSTHAHAIFSEERIKVDAEKYITKCVERYKDSPAQDNWWLMNEPMPGDGESEWKLKEFRKVMKEKYGDIQELNKMWQSDFKSFDEISNISSIYNAEWAAGQSFYDWTRYCNQHLEDFQRWVRDVIWKTDKKHKFHTNPGASLSLYHRQEAAEWMDFLDSFGLSIHPTWHFGMFSLEQYALGVAATCEYGRAITQSFGKTYWVSELSAGNNMFYNCPTANELAGWTWNSISKGAEKVIYWLLNQRPAGNEGGEWALLNFQGEPSSRLKMVQRITEILDEGELDNYQPMESNISILLDIPSTLAHARRGRGMHTTGALCCYQALAERGIASKIEQTNVYDWENAKGKVAILSEMFVYTDELIEKMKTFLDHGNKLIVLGLCGFYDEHEVCRYMDFPLTKEFGAEPEEVFTYYDRYPLQTKDGKYKFEANKILSTLKLAGGEPILEWEEGFGGVKNKLGNGGEVTWIPSSIDLAAWYYGNNEFSRFLVDETEGYWDNQPLQFKEKTEKIVMQTMNGKKGKKLIVLTNGLNRENTVKLTDLALDKASILFTTNKQRKELKSTEITMDPKECLVIKFK